MGQNSIHIIIHLTGFNKMLVGKFNKMFTVCDNFTMIISNILVLT